MCDDDLLLRQAELQAEAGDVAQALDLDPLLRRVGHPTVTGSAALGLMVWRDLDVTTVCAPLDVQQVMSVGTQLAAHPDVRRVEFRNDMLRWNTQPDVYPDGLYLGVTFQPGGGDEWRLDLWFVAEPDRQPDLRHLVTMQPRLNDETRPPILAIKRAWFNRREYGRQVTSWDIYTAVLDAGVRSVEEFDAWLANRARAE